MKETNIRLEKKLKFDPDFSPETPHNKEIAKKLGLIYDPITEVYRDVDGCPVRDKYGQPLG